MQTGFQENKPIYLQIREQIEDQIVDGLLEEDGQIPSTTQMVQFFRVNHITVAKGIGLLVDEGLVYKKRGVGMFVAPGARDRLLEQRTGRFLRDYIRPLVREADTLGLSVRQITTMIQNVKEEEKHES